MSIAGKMLTAKNAKNAKKKIGWGRTAEVNPFPFVFFAFFVVKFAS
jgi:hypothetical protein